MAGDFVIFCGLFMKYYTSSIWKNLESVNVTFNLRDFNIKHIFARNMDITDLKLMKSNSEI